MSVTVNRQRLLETLIELCSIPSPARHEASIAARIREIATERGATVRVDGVPAGAPPANALDAARATAGSGSAPSSDRAPGDAHAASSPAQDNMVLVGPDGPFGGIFLSAHMDTVPVPDGTERIDVRRDDGRITSDGTTILGGDDKVGVALALEMLALCAEHPGHHRALEVLILVQEEIGCQGSRHLGADAVNARIGFNLDGETPPGSAITKAPRKYFYTCSVHGRSAHGALNPDDGINAIVVAADLVRRLPQGNLDAESTGNIGAIRGGTQTNVVPDLVIVEAELRSFSRSAFDAHRETVVRTCRDVAAAHGVSIDLEWRHAYDEYSLAAADEPVQLFSEACRRRGAEPTLLASRGGGDSNNLNAAGLRNVVFGVGMHNIHSPDEYVVESELYAAADLLVEIVFPAR